MENSYSKFAKYYDALMEKPYSKTLLINSWIKDYNPDAASLLEIACGTGTILKLLEKRYIISGLDISNEMLNVAKNKLKNCTFYKQNMTSFIINQKFDVILCIFDSINHLLKFSDWEKVFKSTVKHLNINGLFIFDVNTLVKFNKLNSSKNFYVNKINNDFIIDNAFKLGNNKFQFSTKIFEMQKNNNFKLYEEKITEIAFEKEKILKALKKDFNILKIVDPKRNTPTKNSERLYFVCKLK